MINYGKKFLYIQNVWKILLFGYRVDNLGHPIYYYYSITATSTSVSAIASSILMGGWRARCFVPTIA